MDEMILLLFSNLNDSNSMISSPTAEAGAGALRLLSESFPAHSMSSQQEAPGHGSCNTAAPEGFSTGHQAHMQAGASQSYLKTFIGADKSN